MEIFEWAENIPVTANNLNEMQNTINGNIIDYYSTNEIKTNKVWINNKSIYRRVYEFGALPNSTNKNIDSNLSNIKIVNIYGFAVATNNTTIHLPYAATALANNVSLSFSFDNKIVIETGTNRSEYTGYVILEYTKNSD